MKIILTIATIALGAAAWGQDRPGDAGRGAQLFEREHCVACHSIHGVGGKVGPDLGRRGPGDYTPAVLAGAMWNHAPVMWKAMAARGLSIPQLDAGDVADLFAYFYSLRYFAPPGDAARGKDVFISSGCARCHASQGGVGPPVSSWKATTDPVLWAQQMWNHVTGMTEQAEKAGVRWPRLTVQQMVDLTVYVQNLPSARLTAPTLRVENPAAGEKLFASKNCARCHTLGGTAAPGKIDLLPRTARFRSLVEFAGAMWNHGPQMRRRAAQAGVALPVFQDEEMSDLLAYLFESRIFAEQGSVRRGAAVYKKLRCAACHEGGQPGIPPLSQFRGKFSPFFMTSAVWRHGPQMQAELEGRGMAWPVFTGAEMSDLIAYLNR
ncbi:MAG TPA: c-type cytochrome [Bryobacterales bacterium]|nr:c-type cytochrome [Bryobacterales bacterium]